MRCDLDSQICDPVQLSESILTPVLLPNLSNMLESVLIPPPIILELESPLLGQIPLLENTCGLEFQFLDLDPLLEPISTPEPLLDLSHLPESKSTVLSFHTPFWDEVVDKFDSEISYGIWKLDGVKYLIKILNGYIFLMGYIKDTTGGFLRDPSKVDWAAFRGPIRPPPEPPP